MVDISDLPSDLEGRSTMDRLEALVGMDEKTTDMLIEHLSTALPSPEHLEMCGLVLIDNANKVIPVIRRIFASFPEVIPEFIDMLLVSPFYSQRQAIPKLIVNLDYKDTGATLRRCLKDPVVSVVRSAVSVLEEYERLPFGDDELIEIVADLNDHYSDYVQCAVSDVLILIRRETPFVSEMCKSGSWRKRHALAKRVSKLSEKDRMTVYLQLSQDPEEEIRICLARSMECVNEWSVLAPRFLRDSSPEVRALAVQKVGNREEFQELLRETVSDTSWEVRKELLCVQRSETYRNVAIPLINSLTVTPRWRVRKEVLSSVALISKHDGDLLRDLLSRHLLMYLRDSVYEIRIEASRAIEELVPMYSWTIEWLPEIESVIRSTNYLHRVTVANAALSFDKVHNTAFVRKLLSDVINNVRLHTLDMMNINNVDEGTRDMVEALCDDKDEEISKAAKSLLGMSKTG